MAEGSIYTLPRILTFQDEIIQLYPAMPSAKLNVIIKMDILKMRENIVGRIILLFLLLTMVAGCGLKRNPIPIEMQSDACLPGYDEVRFFGDTTPKHMDKVMQKWAEMGKKISFPMRSVFCPCPAVEQMGLSVPDFCAAGPLGGTGPPSVWLPGSAPGRL